MFNTIDRNSSLSKAEETLSEAEKVLNIFRLYGFAIPLPKTTRCFLISKNHDFMPAVVEVMQQSTSNEVYYIHFLNCNKRLDRWTHITNLRPLKALKIYENSLINPSIISPSLGYLRRVPTRKSLARSNKEIQEVGNSLYEKLYEERTAVKNIQSVIFGRLKIDCWYFSPFPKIPQILEKLYFCEMCLFYTIDPSLFIVHIASCKVTHPPGNEVYRDDDTKVSVFEMDGNVSRNYCQCLCLFGKLFLERKTLFYEVSLFKFYVVTLFEEGVGFRPAGFFSKEKMSPECNNLSCIVVFPHFQRKGFGRFIVEFSYALSRKERIVGGPETPISDLGRLLYKSFWTEEVIKVLVRERRNICTAEISDLTFISEKYVINTLDVLDLLRYFKGQYIVPYDRAVLDKYLKFFSKEKKLPFFAKYISFDDLIK